jgi:hypothetical protein
MTAGNLLGTLFGNHFVRHWNCLQWKQQAVPSIARKFNSLENSVSMDVSAPFRIISETMIPLAGNSDRRIE